MKARVNLKTTKREDEMALWFLAFIRRKQAVGGWLFVFFLQLFWLEIELMIRIPAMLMAPRYGGDRIPAIVAGESQLGILLSLAMFAANTWIVVGAAGLLRTRKWRYVIYVRAGLAGLAGLAAVRIVKYPTTASWQDALFPVVFLPYFFLSQRVRRVYQTHDWDESEVTSLALTNPGNVP
jgi:hypothetical protein